MLKRILNIALVFFVFMPINGQDTVKQVVDSLPGRFYILQNVTRDGITLPEVEIDEVNVTRRTGIKQRFQWWKYRRLVSNIKKVYPYSLVVREKFTQINDTLQYIQGERARKKFLRDFETDLFGEYEDDIRHMTLSQGKILIKLIDRETQNTSYQLIHDYRGTISALFWQGLARLFGSNLKDEYDPYGEDYIIEKVIYEIEHGRL